MVITLCSIFRNAEPYLERYLNQVADLRKEVDNVRLVLAEGDSEDHTAEILDRKIDLLDLLIHVDHGGPAFGSVNNPQRWDQIAEVVKPTLQLALDQNPEVLVWVEGDLIWDTGVMLKLIERARVSPGRAVAPMVFAAGEDRFYDTYGFRMQGLPFLPSMPYFPKEGHREDELVKIDSCGSCFATRDFQPVRKWTGHWPFYADGRLWLDDSICVTHP